MNLEAQNGSKKKESVRLKQRNKKFLEVYASLIEVSYL